MSDCLGIDTGGGEDHCNGCAERDRLEGKLAEARAARDDLVRIVGFICVAGTLVEGESAVDPPEHAALSFVLRIIADRDAAQAREREALNFMASLAGASNLGHVLDRIDAFLVAHPIPARALSGAKP